jgi:hypothetical protein
VTNPDAKSRAREAEFPLLSPALMKLARLMPENGGSGSLDYKLREMLAGNFADDLLWQHNSDSRRAHKGWPDWFIARKVPLLTPGAALVRELKREGQNPTRGQQEWLDALEAAGFDAGVWRPSDYYSGRIALELAALAGRRISAVTR